MTRKRYSDIEDFDFGGNFPAENEALPFQGWRASDYLGWLESGLKGYLLDGKGAWAFPGAIDSLASRSDLQEGLKAFYDSLDGEQQVEFKKAVVDLLETMPPESRFIPVFANLLSLASLLPAPEVLRVLPKRIGNGYFGFKNGVTEDDLFGIAVRTVAKLNAPREDALKCLRRFVKSRNFQVAYAGTILVALSQADEDGFVAHMRLMRPDLQAMFGKYGKNQTMKRTWAEYVLEVVQLDGVAAALPKLKYFDRNSEKNALDTWLLEGLFAGRRPLLECYMNEHGNLELCEATSRDMTEEVPLTGVKAHELLGVLSDNGYFKRGWLEIETDTNGSTQVSVLAPGAARSENRIQIGSFPTSTATNIDSRLAGCFGISTSSPPGRTSSALGQGA